MKHQLQADVDAMQIENSKLNAKNENLDRNLHSKTELLKTVEEQQRFLVRRLKEDNQKIVDNHKIKEHELLMQYEDLRSYFARHH